jgi:hypothetical protein
LKRVVEHEMVLDVIAKLLEDLAAVRLELFDFVLVVPE